MPFVSTWMQLEIIKLSKLERERQIPCDITCMWNLNYGIDYPIYKTETNYRCGEQTYFQGTGERKRNGQRVWGCWMKTVPFGMNGQWGFTV